MVKISKLSRTHVNNQIEQTSSWVDLIVVVVKCVHDVIEVRAICSIQEILWHNPNFGETSVTVIK
jgi:hypothetical protein